MRYHDAIFIGLSVVCVLFALYLLVIPQSGTLALVALATASASYFFGNPDVIEKLRVGPTGFEASTRVRAKAEELSRFDLPPPSAGAEQDPKMPRGWFAWGEDRSAYEMGSDEHIAHTGKFSGYTKSIRQSQGFGALTQIFKADEYRGKRLKMSGFCKSKAVKGWAGLWMRVDGSNGDLLGFYNMEDRPITDTTDWTQYEIIMDLPDTSSKIAFGSLLVGEGMIWCDTFEFEIVDRNKATTTVESMVYPDRPLNLDFEEISKPAAPHRQGSRNG